MPKCDFFEYVLITRYGSERQGDHLPTHDTPGGWFLQTRNDRFHVEHRRSSLLLQYDLSNPDTRAKVCVSDDVKRFIPLTFHEMRCIIVETIRICLTCLEDPVLLKTNAFLSCAKICVDDSRLSPALHREDQTREQHEQETKELNILDRPQHVEARIDRHVAQRRSNFLL